MKSANDNPKSVHLLDKQHNGKSMIAHVNDGSDNKPLLSEKGAEQHPGNREEVANEQEKFNDLMRMSRELAHRLNNLLATILANTQLMLLILGEEELNTYLKSVEDTTRDAGTIVHDFQKSLRTLADPASQESVPGGNYRSSP